MFSTSGDPDEIHHARPFLSTWAVRAVAAEARKEVGRATREDPEDLEHHTRLPTQTLSWEELLSHFNLKWIHTKFCLRLPLAIFLTEAMAAPKAKGEFFVRKRRPHPIIQAGAIASFIISRNRYANGTLAMVLGVWQFACKSHIDLKRVYCRFGYCVSDKTARNALTSMTTSSLNALRARVLRATALGWFDGIGRHSQLKVGCAGTWVKLDGCAPGAFLAEPYYAKVALQERKTLTTDDLFDSIKWVHIRRAMSAQWVRALAGFATDLEPQLKELNELYRAGALALHRIQPGRKTECQPLRANGEHSTELNGMKLAVADFDKQVGIDSDNPGDVLTWIRGDGASYAILLHLSTYMTPLKTFKNKIATPEIWHTGATDLNSTAANHYGPSTSSDPSSLSKCSNIAGLKRPSNIKSCDYYPTVRNLTLIWNAHVLDCWRIFLDVDNLQTHFSALAKSDQLPDLHTLLKQAEELVDHYATQSAIQASLSADEVNDPDNINKIPAGSPWTTPLATNTAASTNDDDVEPPGLVDIDEPEPGETRQPPVQPKAANDAPKAHTEKPEFDGDRVLRNSQIFMQDFGWWIEFAHAVPEGDIGRVWEIMKIWIFKFAGSSHQNYVNYLLEVYCMLRYEASKDLSDAILNNWLLNIKGELGKWLPGDLHQEHYNKWLEDMIQKHGGDFDNKFYRETISPNVHHFLQIKAEVETAFNLERRSQTHTSPHLRDELTLLLKAFKEEEVHLFRSGRSLGHAAVNQFARGYRRLEEGKMEAFLTKSTVLGDFLAQIRRGENAGVEEDDDVEMRSAADSPTPSSDADASSSPRCSSSVHSSRSSSHVRSSSRVRSSSSVQSSSSSMHSLSQIDPNEPDDDGEDLSDARLNSGTGHAMTVDPESGLIVIEDEVREESDGEEEEQDDEPDEEPEEQSDGEDKFI
ncbi:hypothetical protein DFH06DRAFT_1139927 [Mycena polygramma]|nr:hypothetical protein DFH06DRAFT_1139927 [Mycena polygramma]